MEYSLRQKEIPKEINKNMNITYNVYADGRLAYIGKDKERALTEARIARCWATFVTALCIGDGYSYELEVQ